MATLHIHSYPKINQAISTLVNEIYCVYSSTFVMKNIDIIGNIIGYAVTLY